MLTFHDVDLILPCRPHSSMSAFHPFRPYLISTSLHHVELSPSCRPSSCRLQLTLIPRVHFVSFFFELRAHLALKPSWYVSFFPFVPSADLLSRGKVHCEKNSQLKHHKLRRKRRQKKRKIKRKKPSACLFLYQFPSPTFFRQQLPSTTFNHSLLPSFSTIFDNTLLTPTFLHCRQFCPPQKLPNSENGRRSLASRHSKTVHPDALSQRALG